MFVSRFDAPVDCQIKILVTLSESCMDNTIMIRIHCRQSRPRENGNQIANFTSVEKFLDRKLTFN